MTLAVYTVFFQQYKVCNTSYSTNIILLRSYDVTRDSKVSMIIFSYMGAFVANISWVFDNKSWVVADKGR
jgi:hypothetical protein